MRALGVLLAVLASATAEAAAVARLRWAATAARGTPHVKPLATDVGNAFGGSAASTMQPDEVQHAAARWNATPNATLAAGKVGLRVVKLSKGLKHKETVGELLDMAARLRSKMETVADKLRQEQVEMMKLQTIVGIFSLNLTLASRSLTATDAQARKTRENVKLLAAEGPPLNRSFEDLENGTAELEGVAGTLAVREGPSKLVQRLTALEASLSSAEGGDSLVALRHKFDHLSKSIAAFHQDVAKFTNVTLDGNLPGYIAEHVRLLSNLSNATGGLRGLRLPGRRC